MVNVRKKLTGLISLSMVTAMLGLGAVNGAAAASFSYTYANPYDAQAQTYIHSTSNVRLNSEGDFRYWMPTTVGSTLANTTPGVIVYKFDFGTDVVGSASLKTFNPTFHWRYSKGHNYFYGSTDGTTWVQLIDNPPPAFGEYSGGWYNGLLPSSLLGGSQLWFKAELFSYGGGSLANTAQHSRWGTYQGSSQETFKLEVDFADSPPAVPVPAALPLLGLGLAVFGVVGRRQRKQVA